jgi:hypothetical protein
MADDSNLFLFLGSQLKDEYGNIVGNIVSYAVNPKGKTEYVYVEQSDGKFLKHSAENLKIEGSEIILLPQLKTDSSFFSDQIPLIWRKDQALKSLVEKQKISPEAYEELHRNFESALEKMKKDARSLVENINMELNRCSQKITNLNYALVHLEIEHEIGKINDTSYKQAFTIIQDGLKKTIAQKADLEEMQRKLDNLLLGEQQYIEVEEKSYEEATETTEESEQIETLETPAPQESTLPEPPVVVYVKEADQAST